MGYANKLAQHVIEYEPVSERTNNLGPTRSNTNRAVQSQKMVRGRKILDLESRGTVLSV